MKRIFILIMVSMLLISSLFSAAIAETGIDLSSANGKLIISEAGVYTLTGSVKGTVEVDPGAGEVELILDNITIDGSTGAGIKMVSGDSLKITLAEGSKNSVSGIPAIEAERPLYFNGAGQLIAASSSTPIQASKGYNISGGTLITLGNEPCDTPAFTAQNVLTANLDASLPSNTYIALKTDAGSQLLAFTAKQKFSSLLISAENLSKGSYQISADSVPVLVNGNEAFTVANGINKYKAVRSSQEAFPEWTDDTVTAFYEEVTYPAAAQTSTASAAARERSAILPVNTQKSAAPQIPAAQEKIAADIPPQNNQASAAQETAVQPEEANNQQPAQSESAEQPVFPENGQNNQQGFPGQQNGQQNFSGPQGMQPGGINSSYVSADSPSEIVTSTLENTAASLEADLDNAETIVMSDENNQVKISDSGTYVVTGSSSDGNITVKKAATGVVLILEDLDLTSTTGATVSVNKEAEVKVIISGNVTLTDAENPEDENSEDEAIADAFDGAAFKAKTGSNVYITGDGTLTVYGKAKNGIKAGDDTNLMIDGVTININADNDGINANYDLTLLSGSFTINAGDDAIHADHILTVGRENGTGPKINVMGSEEGLEATVVNIYGGDIRVTSNDDAINAANKDGLFENELRYAVNMMGGTVNITSGYDGIDSNGDVNLIGGAATITSANAGGDAGIDYDGSLYISDQFSLNNSSGVAGPDGMPGQNAQMTPPDQNGMNGQMIPSDQNGMTGQMTPPDQNGQNGQTAPSAQSGQMMPPAQNGMNGQMTPPNQNGQNGQMTPPDQNGQNNSLQPES